MARDDRDVRSYYTGLPMEYEPRIHRAFVIDVKRVSAGMLRITLGGADMHDYPTTGVGDEYVRLFFPEEPDGRVHLPYVTGGGWAFHDDAPAAEMRTYTVREHRPGAVDIDFVEHAGGLASTWAAQAVIGQELGINPPRALCERPERMRRQILLADEPGLPAALRIAELSAATVETHVVAEIRGDEHRMDPGVEVASMTWLRGAGNGRSPSQLAAALRRMTWDEHTYVWVAAEARVSREVRSVLRKERGAARDAYLSMGYWTDRVEEWRERYEALGPEVHQRIEELHSSDGDEEIITDEVERILQAAGL